MSRRRTWDRLATAAVVLEAMEAGLPAVKTICEVFDVSPAKAAYMLRTVRNEGLLHAGHAPVRAYIYPRTLRQRSWLVCHQCTTPWPCPTASSQPEEIEEHDRPVRGRSRGPVAPRRGT